ncbi:hypothetical protein KEM60_02793 [Austwickia sp. TVS 96-490-7B]|nr:hypothetical protein [Austwickia sp. TVS 96-490-7B]
MASPVLTEQVFHRSVVLILHHTADGAHGLVLNKRLGVDVDRVLPGWSPYLSAPVELFQGGPVSLDTALGLAGVVGAGTPSAVHRLFGGVGVVDLDADPTELSGRAVGMRIFAGYAGWSAGQLESELANGSWFLVNREPADLFPEHPEQLWSTVLRRQPGHLAFVSAYPGNPEWN